MKIYFNALGVITSIDFTDESIRQGSVGNHIKAYFTGKNNNYYTPKLNFTRPDGSKLDNLVMTPDAEDSTLFKFVLNDEWYLAIDGGASLTIFLYDSNGTIVANGQVQFAIEDTDYNEEPDKPTNEQYNTLMTALAGKVGMPSRTLRVDSLPSVGETGVFYIVHDDINDSTRVNIYIWSGTISQYLWVGSNELDLNKYYTKEEGEQFESDVDNRVTSIEDELSSVASGSPKGVYDTVNDLTNADPNHNFIYLVLADNKWYYWSNNQWNAGGTYLSSSPDSELNPFSNNSIKNKSVSIFSGNIEKNTKIVKKELQDGYLNKNGGFTLNQSGLHCYYTDFIPVTPNEVVYYKGYANFNVASAQFFREDGTFLSYVQIANVDHFSKITIPENAAFARFGSYNGNGTPKAFLDLIFSGSLWEDINKTNDNLSETSGKQTVYEQADKYVNISGGFTAASGYSCKYLYWNAKENDKFLYKGVGQSNAASAVFFDSDGLYISGATIVLNSGNAYSEITVPANAVRVMFTSYARTEVGVVLDVIKESNNIKYLEYKSKGIDQSLDNFSTNPVENKAITRRFGDIEKETKIVTIPSKGYLNSRGRIENPSLDALITDYIPAKEGDIFLYKGYANLNVQSVLFFDTNGNVLSYYQTVAMNNYISYTAPENTAFARFCSYDGSGEGKITLEVIYKGSSLDYKAKSLTERADNISGEVENVITFHGYMTLSGGRQYNESLSSKTTYWNVKEGDVFWYKGVGEYSTASVIFFAANGSIISANQYRSSANYTEITIPENCVQVMFSSYASGSYDDVVFDVMKISDNTKYIAYRQNLVQPMLFGKKIVFCGDSFTEGDFSGESDNTKVYLQSGMYKGSKQVYPFFIGNRTGANIVNLAKSGSTIALKEGRDNCFTNLNWAYNVTTIPADADIITIMYGINDNAPIGNLGDTTNDTFYGAWYYAIKWILENRPNAYLGVIISGEISDNKYNAIVNICKYWGIPYLDFWKDNSLVVAKDTYNRNGLSQEAATYWNNRLKVSDTNGHPNGKAQEMWSYAIQQFIERL